MEIIGGSVKERIKHMKKINKFVGEYNFLCNFYPSPFDIGGRVFPTVEHGFQAFKATNTTHFEVIAEADSPGKAKSLGNQVVLRSDWEDMKVSIMRLCLVKKFTHNPELHKKLLETRDAYLEEGNNHGDTIWGTVNGEGQNLLGELLMEVRSLLS